MKEFKRQLTMLTMIEPKKAFQNPPTCEAGNEEHAGQLEDERIDDENEEAERDDDEGQAEQQ